MKDFLKSVLLKTLGEPFEAYLNKRRRQHIESFEASEGLPRITESYIQRHGLTVQDGPFQGMKYNPVSTGSVLVPKLLGSYELELAPSVEALIKRQPRIVVDVGTAEGYYAIGLALRLPEARVYGFDIDANAQTLSRQMAELNGVTDRVTVSGRCDHTNLEGILSQDPDHALIVCDCDGYEAILLDPALVPSLKQADILLETHDFLDATITPTLRANFETTHDLTQIGTAGREPSAYPALEFLSESDRVKAVCEYRPDGQKWLVMTPKARPVA